jgi:predicted RNA-binding Zn-ribbon protein involved in translation (DUF1610 family)
MVAIDTRSSEMSAGRDPAPIAIKGAFFCPKCGEKMQRYKHSINWKPLPGRNFFIFWDRCKKCEYIQNYETAKRSFLDAG